MENAIFEEKKVSKAYMKLSLPLVLSMTVSLIYNLADTFFVAQTQNTNIVAGVSLCAPLFTTLMALGNIFGQGGSSLISRLLGKNDTTATRRVSAFCFWGAILIGALMGFIMLLFRTPLLYVIGANEETFNFARDYYTWLAIGAPALVLSFIHSNLLRSEGMSKESMIGTMGGQGAVYADMAGNQGFCPARPVRVKDTTGAGDAFCAGVAIGLTYGKSMSEACEIGSRLASSVITISENTCPRFLPQELGLDVDVE